MWSDVPNLQFVGRDDAHAALARGDKDDFGAAADDSDLEGEYLPAGKYGLQYPSLILDGEMARGPVGLPALGSILALRRRR